MREACVTLGSVDNIILIITDLFRQIQYMHDGSETTEDSMILELTLVAGTGYTLPGYLQGHLRFPLHVNVTPVNDPPLLEIPTAKVLRLAQVRHEHKLYKFPFFCLSFSRRFETLITR